MNKNECKGNEMTEIIHITWLIDDVLSVRPNLTKEQASAVLVHVRECYDANIGINWNIIKQAADDMFGYQEDWC